MNQIIDIFNFQNAGLLAGKQNGSGALKNIKGGLLLPLISRLSLILALTSPLSGDTFETPEQKSKRLKSINDLTKNHDQMLANNKDRISDIEKNLGVKVDYSYYNGKFFIADKKGNFLLYVDDLNESLPQLKDKIETVKKPSKWNPFNWIFPSAHGEERHTDPYYRREDIPTLKNARDTPDASINDKQAYLRSLEQKYGLPAGILDAQWNKESGRGRHLLSRAGAKGDFQFMDGTAREYGVNVNDFYSSASGAARYLTDLKRKFGSVDKALAAYNWGAGNLQKDLNRHGNRWFEYLPDETRNYVNGIMNQQGAVNNTNNNTVNNRYTINVHVNGKTDGKTLAEEIRRHLPGPSTHATQTANGLS